MLRGNHIFRVCREETSHVPAGSTKNASRRRESNLPSDLPFPSRDSIEPLGDASCCANSLRAGTYGSPRVPIEKEESTKEEKIKRFTRHSRGDLSLRIPHAVRVRPNEDRQTRVFLGSTRIPTSLAES